MAPRHDNPSYIEPVRSLGNSEMPFTSVIMPLSRTFVARSTEYWSAVNPSTNSNASFTLAPSVMIAAGGKMRKS